MGTVLDHLGQACLRARERADVRQIDVATVAGVSHGTISRFETRGTASPRLLDAIVHAYSVECRVDAYELWVSALDEWRQERDA